MQSGAGQLKRLIFACAAALGLAAVPAWAEPKLTLLSTLVWEHDAPWFGGFSGVEVSADGTTLTLITDRGTWATAELIRTEGIVNTVKLRAHQRLRQKDGSPLPERFEDTEGLAIAADGSAFISSETEDRVVRFSLATGRVDPLPGHPDFEFFPINTGLEALAIHPDGRLFGLWEGEVLPPALTPLYSFAQNRWDISHYIPPEGPFRPVGADFDASGRLYLLERTLSPLGFRSRIRRIDLNTSPVTATTLMTTYPATFDNLEAITLWTDAQNRTRLILISDDNFLSLQTTQIVELLLTE